MSLRSHKRWRALFEGPFQSSFQACLYVPLQGWAGWLPTARTSHPPDPAHAETCADPSEHRPINGPSKLACSFPKSSLDQSKRARVKEHRLTKNMIWSCVPPSASTRTDQADLFHSGVRVGRAKEAA